MDHTATHRTDGLRTHVERAIAVRHRLHAIPELGYAEVETAGVIREELDRSGVRHVDGVPGAPTATIATLGDERKPCVALRADIDALPITEQTGLPYVSTRPGVMHACGHDGHTAILLGLAGLLRPLADTLPVCVKLIWQPAEEGGGGGRRLTEAGVLDGRIGPKVGSIYGLHGWPGLPVGRVSTRAGAILASTDEFSVTLRGRGGHAAFPHLCDDPIVAASACVTDLQQIVSRRVDPTEPLVLSVTTIAGGRAHNVIPDVVTFGGTARTLSPQTRERVRDLLKSRCEAVASAHGCSADVVWTQGYPATINDPAAAAFVERIARKTLGDHVWLPAARPTMGGEDFAYYLERVPGCFFLIGTDAAGDGRAHALHTDRYDFADAAIETGVRMFAGIVHAGGGLI